jgi:Ca2+-binding RTX toxin-like protein
MQRIITKRYNFTLLLLSITLLTNIHLDSIYSQEDPTNALFDAIGKDIDKSIIPKEAPREVSPKIELEAQIYDPREIIPIGVDIRTGNATGTVWDDIIIGDNLENFINGSSGNDIIKGLIDIDTLYGHTGNDVLQGGATGDKLFGGADDDTLAGQSDDDYLSGGDGNDKLFGEFGDDTLQGGFGADYFNCGDGIDNIIDFSQREGDLQDVTCEIVG